MSAHSVRLAALEAKLGIVHGKQLDLPSDDTFQKRLEDLKNFYEEKTDPAFRESFLESERLLQELDAGTALTHQTSVSSTPLYYRRQEVLAASKELKTDFEQLNQILNLLLVSQPPRDAAGGSLREEEVTQAPIVTIPPVSEENAKRLDQLQTSIGDLTGRTQSVAGRVDALLKLQQALIATISEKLVAADEAIAAKE